MKLDNLFRTTLIVTLLITASPLVAAAAGGGGSSSAPTTRSRAAYETQIIIDAVVADSIEELQTLVEAGADVASLKTKDGTPALRITAMFDSVAVAQFLLDHGAAVNEVDNHGNTALHSAAAGDHASSVKLLIARGALVNVKNKNGSTALHEAVCRFQVKWGNRNNFVVCYSSNALNVLIEADAALDICDADGNTALMKAASCTNISAIRKLLAAGANPFAVNALGATMATILATKGMSPDEISALLKGPAWQRRKDAVAEWKRRSVAPFEIHAPAAAGGAGAPAAPTGGAGIPSAPVD